MAGPACRRRHQGQPQRQRRHEEPFGIGEMKSTFMPSSYAGRGAVSPRSRAASASPYRGFAVGWWASVCRPRSALADAHWFHDACQSARRTG